MTHLNELPGDPEIICVLLASLFTTYTPTHECAKPSGQHAFLVSPGVDLFDFDAARGLTSNWWQLLGFYSWTMSSAAASCCIEFQCWCI